MDKHRPNQTSSGMNDLMLKAKLMQKTVSHQKFGVGTICGAEAKGAYWTIDVSFPGSTSRFVFPECFCEHITTDDAELKELAETLLRLREKHQRPTIAKARPKQQSQQVKGNGSSRAYGYSVYKKYMASYPEYVIIMKEGAFYSAHYKSAYILNDVLGYKVGDNPALGPTTGGPALSIIVNALRRARISYIVVEDESITERYDGSNPFLLD